MLILLFWFCLYLDRNVAAREGKTCNKGPQAGIKPRPATRSAQQKWFLSCSPEMNNALHTLKKKHLQSAFEKSTSPFETLQSYTVTSEECCCIRQLCVMIWKSIRYHATWCNSNRCATFQPYFKSDIFMSHKRFVGNLQFISLPLWQHHGDGAVWAGLGGISR